MNNTIKRNTVGNWEFGGMIGEKIDTIYNGRFADRERWDMIYPQTEEAFRLREDDISHPGRGVWRGEFWGKYLLGAIATCRYYKNDDLKQWIKEGVEGLISTQDENGYIGTYTDSKFYGEGTWNIWCRKYVLWGLIECYELFGDEFIIEAACKALDYMMTEIGQGKDDIVSTGNFIGLPSMSILKPIILLYNHTKKEKYLEYAEYIVNQFSKGSDIIAKGLADIPIHKWHDEPEKWAKSYELISCVEGLFELYKVTNNNDYYNAAVNIHKQLVDWERSAVGSISFNDKFICSKYLINTVAEICDAVYWNRLSFELFMYTKDMHYIDETERTMYNALMTGSSIDGLWGIRRLRMSQRHIPAHRHFLKHHQCCVDNLPRGYIQTSQLMLCNDENNVYIPFYSQGKGLVKINGDDYGITIDGDFLKDERIIITVDNTPDCEINLKLRIPYWCKSAVINIEGDTKTVNDTGTWFDVNRKFSNGDQITIDFDMDVMVEYFDDTVIDKNDPIVKWHEQQWADMGTVGEDNIMTELTKATSLDIEDAIEHRSAVVLKYGPIVLTKDIRLGQDINAFISRDSLKNDIEIMPIKSTENIKLAYELKASNGDMFRVCDFGSSGNTWELDSMFNAWFIINDVD